MNKKNILLLIIGVVVVLVVLAVILLSLFKKEDIMDISGEYKLEKVVIDEKEIDYSNLNFYYVFLDDNTGNIIFDDVKTSFSYEIIKKDENVYLEIKKNNKDVITYDIERSDEGIIISHESLGKLYLNTENVPDTLKE